MDNAWTRIEWDSLPRMTTVQSDSSVSSEDLDGFDEALYGEQLSKPFLRSRDEIDESKLAAIYDKVRRLNTASRPEEKAPAPKGWKAFGRRKSKSAATKQSKQKSSLYCCFGQV